MKSPASRTFNVSNHRQMPQFGIVLSRVLVDQCVCAVRAVELPILVCLRSSGNHVTEIGRS